MIYRELEMKLTGVNLRFRLKICYGPRKFFRSGKR
jgi:hypothetical protein